MTMRFVCALVAGLALSAEGAETRKTYALVAAVGDRFEFVTETSTTGSHIPPYRRRSEEVAANLLNRFVLGTLDRAIVGFDPQSDRLYLSVRLAGDKTPLESVVAELEKIEQRAQWDRIVVATPARETVGRQRMAARLGGLGIFTQPQCQGSARDCAQEFRSPNGVESETPAGGTVKANYFVAPYAYLDIWVLDPKTLEVLDHQRSLESRKVADAYGGIDLADQEAREFITSRFVAVVQDAVREAVRATLLRGEVEVGDVKPVDPKERRP